MKLIDKIKKAIFEEEEFEDEQEKTEEIKKTEVKTFADDEVVLLFS